MLNKLKKSKWILKLIGTTSWKEKKQLVSSWTGSKQVYDVEDAQTNMKDLLKCTLCPNMCRFECPTLKVTQKEMYAPATKARISYHMERGHISMEDLHTAEVAYMCTNCNGCQAWCPMDISAGELLKGVRADLIKKGIYIPKLKEFQEKMELVKTVFTKETFTSDEKLNVNEENPEIFYYMGCVTAEKRPESAKATIEILKMAGAVNGVKICTFADERQCCGGPAYTLGFIETFKKFAEENIALFNKSGAKTIISDCPACVYAIEKYKEFGYKHNFKVMTTAQYFKELIEQKIIKPEIPVDISITFHDPCYAARSLEKQETLLNDPVNINKKTYKNTARWVFSQIPGLELKETFLHGKESLCCGRGGVMHIHNPEISDDIGRIRVSQLKAAGADLIVSACPSCEEGLIFNGAGECQNIGEILLRSLRV